MASAEASGIELSADEPAQAGSVLNRRVIVFYFLLFFGLIASVWSMPSGNFVLVINNPASTPGENMDVIGAAGGAFVASGRYPWMTVAYSQDTEFPARLMKSGALLVLNHQLAVGCIMKDLR